MMRSTGHTIVLAYAALGGVTLAMTALLGDPLTGLFGPRPWDDAAADVALGVTFGLTVVAVSQRAARWSTAMSRMSDGLGEVVRGFLRPRDVFAQACASALAEELFFRGFLQPRFGLIATAVVFGLAHATQDRRLWFWPALSVLFGLAFGWLFEARGSLIAPAVAHFVINYFNLHHLLALEPQGLHDGPRPA
jgi:membrane protease YdiL (CAAX protease family)